jgi:hypothetical protein
MQTVARVFAAGSPVQVSQIIDGSSESLADLYIGTGKIGQRRLSSACYSRPEVLRLAALELWRRGEAEGTRVTLKARRQTVRQFLQARSGFMTGSREYFHDSHISADRVT